ncbi:unnamed protein product [Symbiodinium sp. CCMP2592]|nr:unnamed protein product [Symbiodinium sp. CCMP2592]
MLPQLRLRTLEASAVLGRHVCQDGQLRPGTQIQTSFVMEDNQLLERWAAWQGIRILEMMRVDSGSVAAVGSISTSRAEVLTAPSNPRDGNLAPALLPNKQANIIPSGLISHMADQVTVEAFPSGAHIDQR